VRFGTATVFGHSLSLVLREVFHYRLTRSSAG
jgi:hypothetical protein